MVKTIRKRTIEQLKAQTGGERRHSHFDSVTWETLPDQRSATRHDDQSLGRVSKIGGQQCFQTCLDSAQTECLCVGNRGLEDTIKNVDVGLANLLDTKINLVDESEDSDNGGCLVSPAHRERDRDSNQNDNVPQWGLNAV